MGATCNVVVTQPRRISAISVAERVASERGERLGKTVGYQVRLDSVLPQQPGRILFCTTGILLVKMRKNPFLQGPIPIPVYYVTHTNTHTHTNPSHHLTSISPITRLSRDLSGVSHVIVDEVHERDINSDFLLILLREIVRAGVNVKVILMSASVDAQLYINYFMDKKAK